MKTVPLKFKLNRPERRIYIWCSAMLLLLAGSVAAFYHHRPFRALLAAYVTDLSDRSESQRWNIEKAGQTLHGVIIESGQTFSLNDQAGPYTLEKGFRPERSFLGEHLTETPGGGVCQLASTLYNAAKQAGMQILERVPHSLPVHSVPKGQDATLAYGVADLKFKNPYPFPVKIQSQISQNQLLVEIWGKEPRHDSL